MNNYPDKTSACWLGWDSNTSLPTQSEWEIAVNRYQLTLCDGNDSSDWCCGLEFVMSTYSTECWAEFFKEI